MGKTRAQTLLESYLDEKQRADFRKYGHFFVIAESRRVYQLKDGSSVVSWHQDGQRTAFGVWACDEFSEDMADRYTSLLTQLLFLTSTRPEEMLEVACTEGGFFHDARGCPPMRKHLYDPEGVVPRATSYE